MIPRWYFSCLCDLVLLIKLIYNSETKDVCYNFLTSYATFAFNYIIAKLLVHLLWNHCMPLETVWKSVGFTMKLWNWRNCKKHEMIISTDSYLLLLASDYLINYWHVILFLFSSRQTEWSEGTAKLTSLISKYMPCSFHPGWPLHVGDKTNFS